MKPHSRSSCWVAFLGAAVLLCVGCGPSKSERLVGVWEDDLGVVYHLHKDGSLDRSVEVVAGQDPIVQSGYWKLEGKVLELTVDEEDKIGYTVTYELVSIDGSYFEATKKSTRHLNGQNADTFKNRKPTKFNRVEQL